MAKASFVMKLSLSRGQGDSKAQLGLPVGPKPLDCPAAADDGGRTWREATPMHRTLAAIAALGLLLVAFDASAAGGPPYKLDAKGNCHDSSGKFAKKTLCSAPAAAKPAAKPAAKQCRDA